MRLVNIDGRTPHAGRVEVYARADEDNNTAVWGNVCGIYWNIEDAKVVCRQLGYPDALTASFYVHYGGQIILDNVQCIGTELDILTCPHSPSGIDIHNCYYLSATADCIYLGKYYKVVISIHIATTIYYHFQKYLF